MMDKNTHDVLIAYAPYIAGIVSVLVAYLSYLEAKRRTKHDEMEDLYDRVNEDNKRLRTENERLTAELKEHEHED